MIPLLVGCVAALAAEGDATLAGAVRDAAGAPLASVDGIELELATPDGFRTAVPVAPDGAFAFAGLPPGTYTLHARLAGFAPAVVPVTLAPGRDTVVEVRLAPEGVWELEVLGRTAAEERVRSADSVTVVDTEEARRRTADLGEVMARTQGLAVQRSGGLGSGERISLQGFTDDQIRFFLDGVPLHLAGYPFGLANVPVDLVERIEVYKGVVPVRLGADALGGAIQLVTPSDPGTHAGASWTGGSFDTHRLAGSFRHRDPDTGLLARFEAFHDTSRNDYPIDVEVADLSGQLHPATVPRFHDAYRATGAAAEVGVVERGAVERLGLRAFVSDHHKELQHDVLMTAPYGEVTYGGRSAGVTARAELDLSADVRLDLVTAYARDERWFEDVGACVYDWYGRCLVERALPGELGPATDQLRLDDDLFGRAVLTVEPGARQQVVLSVTPTGFSRTGDDAEIPPDRVDPLTARRSVRGLVTGLEHGADLALDRVRTVVFAKDYLQWVDSEETALGGGAVLDAARRTHAVGAGFGLRVEPWRDVLLKASGERATRLPDPEELFGDGALVLDNPDLVPERSWNGNLELVAGREGTAVGDLRLDVALFGRASRDLVVLLGDERYFAYYNVFGARTLGVEGAGGWTSPGGHLAVGLAGTWQDVRNASEEGAFGSFAGDRIPNRPWLFATSDVRLAWPEVTGPRDELSLAVTSRYVHPFLRGWESVGLVAFKQEIPAQLSHAVALGWVGRGERNTLSATLEVQNLTDATLYDTFGVQRPGRGVYGKFTIAR